MTDSNKNDFIEQPIKKSDIPVISVKGDGRITIKSKKKLFSTKEDAKPSPKGLELALFPQEIEYFTELINYFKESKIYEGIEDDLRKLAELITEHQAISLEEINPILVDKFNEERKDQEGFYDPIYQTGVFIELLLNAPEDLLDVSPMTKSLYLARTKPQLIASLNGIKDIAIEYDVIHCQLSKELIHRINDLEEKSQEELAILLEVCHTLSTLIWEHYSEIEEAIMDTMLGLLDHDIEVIVNPLAYDIKAYTEEMELLTDDMFDKDVLAKWWEKNREALRKEALDNISSLKQMRFDGDRYGLDFQTIFDKDSKQLVFLSGNDFILDGSIYGFRVKSYQAYSPISPHSLLSLQTTFDLTQEERQYITTRLNEECLNLEKRVSFTNPIQLPDTRFSETIFRKGEKELFVEFPTPLTDGTLYYLTLKEKGVSTPIQPHQMLDLQDIFNLTQAERTIIIRNLSEHVYCMEKKYTKLGITEKDFWKHYTQEVVRNISNYGLEMDYIRHQHPAEGFIIVYDVEGDQISKEVLRNLANFLNQQIPKVSNWNIFHKATSLENTIEVKLEQKKVFAISDADLKSFIEHEEKRTQTMPEASARSSIPGFKVIEIVEEWYPGSYVINKNRNYHPVALLDDFTGDFDEVFKDQPLNTDTAQGQGEDMPRYRKNLAEIPNWMYFEEYQQRFLELSNFKRMFFPIKRNNEQGDISRKTIIARKLDEFQVRNLWCLFKQHYGVLYKMLLIQSLLKVKNFQSKFRKSLHDQIVEYLTIDYYEQKYSFPLSRRQQDTLDKGGWILKRYKRNWQ